MLMLAVFGACSVEAVEALTIVLASGTTRGWRSAMEGTGAALVALGVIIGAVGVPLVHYVPIDALRPGSANNELSGTGAPPDQANSR